MEQNKTPAREGILFVISGPAGSGKGTVVKLLTERHPEILLSVSATTRNPRPGEVHGVQYYFITKPEFEKRLAADAILEHTTYCDNYYGTPRDAVEAALADGHDMILEIEVDGAMQIKNKVPGTVAIMLIPPNSETLEARLRGRGTETEEVILRRLARAREEIGLMSDYDYVVVNGDGEAERCAEDIYEIIMAEHRRVERNTAIKTSFFN
jgi:guanylate kinase